MKQVKTSKYKYELTEELKELNIFLTDWLNQIWITEDDRKWGTKDYYRRLPFIKPMINSCSEEEYIISDWVESLDDEYHQLYPELGDRLVITYNHRKGSYTDGGYNSGYKVWEKYRRTYNRLLKEIIYDGKRYYNDEERVVMNLFRGFFLVYKDVKCFLYWRERIQGDWEGSIYYNE